MEDVLGASNELHSEFLCPLQAGNLCNFAEPIHSPGLRLDTCTLSVKGKILFDTRHLCKHR